MANQDLTHNSETAIGKNGIKHTGRPLRHAGVRKQLRIRF